LPDLDEQARLGEDPGDGQRLPFGDGLGDGPGRTLQKRGRLLRRDLEPFGDRPRNRRKVLRDRLEYDYNVVHLVLPGPAGSRANSLRSSVTLRRKSARVTAFLKAPLSS